MNKAKTHQESAYDIARRHGGIICHEIRKKTTLEELKALCGAFLSEDVIDSGVVFGKAFDKITIEMLRSIQNAGIRQIRTFTTYEKDKCFIKMLADYPHIYNNFRDYSIGINENLSYLEGKILYRDAVFENEKREITVIAKASEIITKAMIDRLVDSGVKYVSAADIVSKGKMKKTPKNEQEKPVNPPVLSEKEEVPPKKSLSSKPPKITQEYIEGKQTEETEIEQPRGRPIEHKEEWSKITVVLLDKQIHWLDQLATNIRLNTKTAISRAEIIRALIAAVEQSGDDLSQLKSEDAIKDHLLKNRK